MAAKKPAPAPTSLANFANTLPADEQVEIGKTVCDNYDTDINSRSEWEAKRNKWYKLWACHRDTKSDPWPGCSNVCIPLLATASNQFHARSYQSIFNAPSLVDTIPIGKADEERSGRVKRYLNWQLRYEMDEYEEVFDKVLQLLPIDGTAFKKCYWDKDNARPVTEYISALDLVLPYRTKSLQTARRATHRLWLHYDELQERDTDGLYTNFDKVQETPVKTDDSELAATAEAIDGTTPESVTEKPHLILECHRKWLIKGVMTPVVFTVDYDSQTLLRAVSRKIKDQVLTYFTDYHFIPNPEGFYSFGFGHFLEPLNEMANTAFNQIFDSGRLTNQPFGFYDRRAGIKSREIKLHPGKMIEAADASKIFFPSMQRVDQTLFMVLGQLQQYVEQFTSTSDYLMGREAKGTKTPTAHGTMAIIEQGLVIFGVMAKRIYRQMHKELRLIMVMNQIFLDDTKEFRVLEDGVAFDDLKKEDFSGVYDVIPVADPTFSSRSMRRAEAQELYQILMANPLVSGNPQLGMQPNVKAMYEITRDLLETYDKKNHDKYLPPPPPDLLTPEMENVKFMQGEYTKPKMGENHEAHFKTHATFAGGEFFASMPDDYKELLKKHLQETMEVAALEAQQMQQLGAQQQPGIMAQPPGAAPQQGPPPAAQEMPQ